jgi:hypothetical protein
MEENDPTVLCTDTCPHNAPFYKKIYGSNLLTRLGLFHLMHRIVNMLDTHSMVYWKVLVNLKVCFYTYREVDLSNLIRCLMDGSFYRDGSKLSHAQINAIQQSKKWKSQFDAFLQKTLKLRLSINYSLSQWVADCKDLADDTGRQAFTHTTIKAVNNQLDKVEHAEDSNEIDMFMEIPAGKASSHGLPKWQSKHQESEGVLQSLRTSLPLEGWPLTTSRGAGSARRVKKLVFQSNIKTSRRSGITHTFSVFSV